MNVISQRLTRMARLATARGNGALPAALFLGQRYAGLRPKEMGDLAGGLEYPAVNAAIARFEKHDFL